MACKKPGPWAGQKTMLKWQHLLNDGEIYSGLLFAIVIVEINSLNITSQSVFVASIPRCKKLHFLPEIGRSCWSPLVWLEKFARGAILHPASTCFVTNWPSNSRLQLARTACPPPPKIANPNLPIRANCIHPRRALKWHGGLESAPLVVLAPEHCRCR